MGGSPITASKKRCRHAKTHDRDKRFAPAEPLSRTLPIKHTTTRKKDFYVRRTDRTFFAIFGYQANPKPSFMKKSLVLLLISSLVSGLYARQPRTVVEPPFAFRNSGTLEIERIELAPESTTVYIQAYFRPHNWIRISSETYIRTGAEGEKLTVRSADGMPLDTEFYMPRDGTARLLAELSSRRSENSEDRPNRKRLPRLLQNIRHRPNGQKSEAGPFGSRKKIQESRPADGKFHRTRRQRQPGPDRQERLRATIPAFSTGSKSRSTLRSSGTERPNSPCPSGRTDRSKRG